MSLFATLFLFQNCGPQFQVASLQDDIAQSSSQDSGSSFSLSLVSLADQKLSTLGTRRGCRIHADQNVSCWGDNSRGQLGNGTLTSSAVPVAVSGLSGALMISSGPYHSCVITQDHRVKCWGQGNFGALGDGRNQNSSTPVDVMGVEGAVQVGTGDNSSCALLQTGRVKCWGHNSFFQLGNGSSAHSGVPVDVLNLENVIQLAVGEYHSCALHREGRVSCWGLSGTVATDAFVNSSVPVLIPELSGIRSVASGYMESYFLTQDDRLILLGSLSAPLVQVIVASGERIKALPSRAERRSTRGHSGICWQTEQDTLKCFDQRVGTLEISESGSLWNFSRACLMDSSQRLSCWDSETIMQNPVRTSF